MGANPGLSRRAIEQEQEYWQRLGNVVDDKLCRVYGAVEKNLQSYHQLLKDRASGLREVGPRHLGDTGKGYWANDSMDFNGHLRLTQRACSVDVGIAENTPSKHIAAAVHLSPSICTQ